MHCHSRIFDVSGYEVQVLCKKGNLYAKWAIEVGLHNQNGVQLVPLHPVEHALFATQEEAEQAGLGIGRQMIEGL